MVPGAGNEWWTSQYGRITYINTIVVKYDGSYKKRQSAWQSLILWEILSMVAWIIIPGSSFLSIKNYIPVAPCHILLSACHKSRQNIYSHPIHLRLGHANGFENWFRQKSSDKVLLLSRYFKRHSKLLSDTSDFCIWPYSYVSGNHCSFNLSSRIKTHGADLNINHRGQFSLALLSQASSWATYIPMSMK